MGVINEKLRIWVLLKRTQYLIVCSVLPSTSWYYFSSNNKELDELKKVEKSADGQGYVANS